ncbi:hypothetical protein B0H10DRAFT_2122627 [Mycena sp. CBHHK59/15]|nr:hypothetical protein B0H10DRAFT_2122627 [Mycena sp. CBHHK59/15]
MGLRVAKIIALYSKGGGKNGKHNAIERHHNISAVSYLGVQVFEHSYGRQFREIPQATARLQTMQFRFLPPFTFLCRLSGSPKANGSGLELTLPDANLFQELGTGPRSWKPRRKTQLSGFNNKFI